MRFQWRWIFLAAATCLVLTIPLSFIITVPDASPEELYAEYKDLNQEEIYQLWRNGDEATRAQLIHAVLGRPYIGRSADGLVSNPESSLVWGMNQDEVIDALGEPGRKSETKVAYRLIVLRPQTIADKIIGNFVPGASPNPDWFIIYFDNESGRVSAIDIAS